MTEAFVFKMTDRAGAQALKYLEGVSEEARTQMPAGYSNNLHWQLGHILTVADRVVNGLSGRQPVYPDTYTTFFGPGTKPADWQGEPPAWDELVANLQSLPQRFREEYEGKFDEGLANKENFAKAETLGDLLWLNAGHMQHHGGFINALARTVRN
ncbi:DinB family protein [Saccharibacillus sp. JS10]|uniref:DinB family protein n=1 Tax=Saccharibacillus sp. JS10 TaxID=2950552 RepID=UPI00210B7701|nr:DinB family protein [Saccharibacillus sp. JS10]MCQ4085413.1 DinB family protein [Saccharibacillus sp. JS10]